MSTVLSCTALVGFLVYIQCARGVYMVSLDFFGKGDDAKVFGVIGGIMSPIVWVFMPGMGWVLIFGFAAIMTLADLLTLGQPKNKI